MHEAVGTQSPFKQHWLSPAQVLLLVVPLLLRGHVYNAAQVASGTHISFKQQSKFVGHPFPEVVPAKDALHVEGVVFAQVAVGVHTPSKQQVLLPVHAGSDVDPLELEGQVIGLAASQAACELHNELPLKVQQTTAPAVTLAEFSAH